MQEDNVIDETYGSKKKKSLFLNNLVGLLTKSLSTLIFEN